MRFTLSDILAPHYCTSCEEIGTILCARCKYDIVNELTPSCLRCAKPLPTSTMECTACQLPYSKQWCTGELRESLQGLIYAMKFERNYEAIRALVDILDEGLAPLPRDVIVTYIPTITPHVRQRGYDHARRLAEGFATARNLPLKIALKRAHNTVQRGENRKTRIEQAKLAFTGSNVNDAVYLLIDDVSTTGATIEAGAKELLAAGAKEVWVAVLAHQPLESESKN